MTYKKVKREDQTSFNPSECSTEKQGIQMLGNWSSDVQFVHCGTLIQLLICLMYVFFFSTYECRRFLVHRKAIALRNLSVRYILPCVPVQSKFACCSSLQTPQYLEFTKIWSRPSVSLKNGTATHSERRQNFRKWHRSALLRVYLSFQ